MEKMRFCAPCLFGLEGILADELRGIDAADITPENGRVLFSGGFDMLARANIRLRTAERVEIVLGRFRAETFDELFEGVKKLPLEQFIGKFNAFPVNGWSLESKLHSIPDCQKIVKKAAVDRLASKYRISWFEESAGTVPIRFSIYKDVATIMLDTSGDGLHKRGYRAVAGGAPIKETLAAAMVMLSRPYPDSNLYDPFCGSGTILIEGALHARNIAPGIKRRFCCEDWGTINQGWFKDERIAARQDEDNSVEFTVFGSDIDPEMTGLTLANAEKAGVKDCFNIVTDDISSFMPETRRGIVVTNPPYGERMLDIDEARKLYIKMGERFIQKPGWRYAVISPDADFEKLFGRQADKRRKLYNGMLRCNLYMYFK